MAKAKTPTPATVEMVTTGISIPRDLLALLRSVATERANRQGGRASISAIIVAMVEEKRAALEKELRGAR